MCFSTHAICLCMMSKMNFGSCGPCCVRGYVTICVSTPNRGQGVRYTECSPGTCSLVYVVPIAPRLVGLTFGQKF